LAQPTDESKVSILPEPELNPLLNPLLAAHMGRWAEVYFTNPPEKRAQAVSDLVRELASHPAPAEVSPQRGDRDGEPRHGRTPGLLQSESTGSYAEEAAIVCETCGHKNSGAHRYCGMCGLPLAPIENSEAQQNAAEAAQVAAPGWYEPEESAGGAIPNQPDSAADFAFQGQDNQPQEEPPLSWRKERPAELHMLSQYQPEPASHNYRLYVGVVVTILLGLLVYVTWRNNASSSGGNSPTTLPQALPTSSGESPAAAPSRPAQDAPASQLNSNNSAEPTRAAAPPSQSARQPDSSTVNNNGRVKTQAPQLAPVNANSAVDAAGQSGFVELSTAEKYLKAGPGTARDSQQAASWLWKAVAKKNLTATMLLSDLYLRGDGVPKSCDQAHLLLDAAARKGVAAAAERLRNLPAFGCQ
jgi:TPR repeat protein